LKDEYLSAGFTDVDGSGNHDAYFSCLALLDSLEYFREYKLKSYELLKLGHGVTVLEAGCGLGDDAFRIAEKIMPGGKVTGIDISAAMIDKARSNKLSARLPVEFQTGDIRSLPFPDSSFARCRIDRTLQHISHPEKVISELARVLEPNGLLLAYDNDWGTFTVTSHDIETTRTIENLWCDSFINGWIGRNLNEYFISSGLSDVEIYPGTMVIKDFETADKVFNLRQTAQRAIESKVISPAQEKSWIEELVDRTEKGIFMAAVTAYTVVGKKK